MTQTAKLVQRGTHLVWRCPCCDRVLGEVHGDRVTVKAGDRLVSFNVQADAEQICPRCGTVSTARKETAA